MTKEEFRDLFVKVCINKLPAKDNSGKLTLYRRNDLYQLSKKAFENGEDYFFYEPVNINDPYGQLKESEPKYAYKVKNSGYIPAQEFESFLNSL